MQCFTLQNSQLKITLSDYGASWLSCQVKMAEGWREVLVTTTPERWQEQTAYFGATIGRYANRIAKGRYNLNGETFVLAQNHGENNLHGGIFGADKLRWDVDIVSEQAVRFRKRFANGEEGFGGNIDVTVEYRLNDDNVEVVFDALSDADSPLCLTNHAYFNLSTEPTIHQHFLQLNADTYLPVGSDGIPNAPLKSVENSGFDFRQPRLIGESLLADDDQQLVKGYDHAFVLHNGLAKNARLETACILSTHDLTMILSTTMPVLQLYTGNWLGGQPDAGGGHYIDYAGVALEPEFLPDTPNHPEWWEIGGITKAGERYQHTICYRFVPAATNP